MARKSKRGRDSGTGKFITIKEAERRPKTTVIETIKVTVSPLHAEVGPTVTVADGPFCV